jgi:HD-like signal output (HDOD) protein
MSRPTSTQIRNQPLAPEIFARDGDRDLVARNPALKEAVDQVSEISTLPNVAMRIMEVACDPDAGAQELKTVVEADPTLCVRVLRCVNSPLYGLREEVADLNRAICYLGFNAIRDLAVTATVCELFRSPRSIGTYQRPGLWRHLVAVGICARMIAIRTRLDGFENAFIAGLLHDIGIILADQHRHDEFQRVIHSLSPQKTLPETELEAIGYTHCQLGYLIGKKWLLPSVVLSAIQFHHEPHLCSRTDEAIVHCVSIANLICTLKDITSVGMKLVRLAPQTLEVLQLRKEDLRVMGEDLDHEIALHENLFEIHRAGS